MAKFTKEEATSLMTLAGFVVEETYELVNQYWPNVADYDNIRRESPWFLFLTEEGLIQVGWRKRVLNIDWSGSDYRATVEEPITQDDTTKTDTCVHAWNLGDAVKYLTTLKIRMNDRPFRVDPH